MLNRRNLRYGVPLWMATQAGTPPLLEGLFAFWEFSAGAVDADSSGNGRTLTLVNTPTNPAGVVGNALGLTAVNNEYATRAFTAGDLSGSVTALGWGDAYGNSQTELNIQQTTTPQFAKYSGVGFHYFFLRTSAGFVQPQLTPTPGGAVYMWACVFNATTETATLYTFDATNGKRSNSVSTSGATVDLSIVDNLIIGAEASGFRNYDGWLDQMVIANRVWTETEIEWFYNSGSGRSYADLSSYTG